MLQSEQDSNVSNWVSEYPAQAGFIRRNELLFGMFPPAIGDKEVTDEQWKRLTATITANDLESEKLTGEK